MSLQTRAVFGLVLVTAIWGSTFIVIKDALDHIAPLDYLGIRFVIAAIVPALLFQGRLRRAGTSDWVAGLALGGLYGLAQVAQTIGLKHTDASVSGFITGTYVVITPVILWALFRQRVSRGIWIAVMLAIGGLATISLTGVNGGGLGELLTLTGAFLYALHIVLLDRWATRVDAQTLTVTQLIGVGLTCSLLAVINGVEFPHTPSVWGAILYTAIVAGVVTMLLQTWSQRHLKPTNVAILMTLEPVFASIFAIGFGGELLTKRLAIGGGLILAATFVGIRASRLPADSRRHHNPRLPNTQPAT